jgi:drug/metabolite transporter (DMT)-like permease
MIKFYLVILGYTFFSSLGTLFLKLSADTGKGFSQLFFFEIWFYVGGLLYLTASAGSIFVLIYLPYSTVYFLSALTYIWSILLSYIFLQEKIDRHSMVSIAFIFSGIFLIAV